jgi:lysophospholipase L1-like esterase
VPPAAAAIVAALPRPGTTLGRKPLLALAAVVAATLALGTADAWAGTQPSYYISLGDSLARGWQPSSNGRSGDTTQGYVDTVASELVKRHPGLQTLKLGCPGETTYTMMSGGSCKYSEGSQLAAAEAALKAQQGHVVAVTVNIGDNDVETCVSSWSVDGQCVQRQMSALKQRLPAIASRLGAAAGQGVPIVGLTDYDQFLAFWLDGSRGRAVARRTVAIVGRLNTTVDGIYARGGIRVADAWPAFATDDFSHYVTLSGQGQVPRAVKRICAWTWACSGPPIGFNDHANATGYRVLGQVVLKMLKDA